MPLLSDDPMWEAFGVRAMLNVAHRAADVGECRAVIRRVGDDGVDAWHREWRGIAERLREAGETAAAAGRPVSAREALMRAATYHRASYWPLYGRPVDPRLREAHAGESAAFERAAALWDTPLEPVEIPVEGTHLPGFLATVDDSAAPRPLIVQLGGYDSTLQETFFAHGPAGVGRGYNVLTIDGPGQGRPLIRDGVPMRPDWENVVRPVLDWALERPEVEPGCLVLTGWSFGGFLAPRAAGSEPRLAALVADPGQWDQREGILRALPLSPDQRARFPDVDRSLLDPMEEALRGEDADPMLRWRLLQRGPFVHGVDTLFDYLAEMMRYELSPVAAGIRCPTVLTAAEDDPLAAGAPALAAAVAGPVTLLRFTRDEGAGDHCEAGARALYEQRVFDRLDEVLPARSR